MIKKKVFKSKKGFTLVEMMIVIAIIGLLAFLAMTAFGSANRSAKLDIAVDTLVSVIRQQQGLAKSGSIDNTAVSNVPASQGVYCYGVRFTADTTAVVSKNAAANGAQVQLIKVPYIRLGLDKADYCDIIDPIKHLSDFSSISDVIIKSINVGSLTSDANKNQVGILFKPPFAKAEVLTADSVDPDYASEVQIVVQSAFSNESERIIFSPAGGTVHKENIATL